MSERPLEYCFNCGDATGHAGLGDGSLYCECDEGPFCNNCWGIHHKGNTLLADREALVRYVRAMIALNDNIRKQGMNVGSAENNALWNEFVQAHEALSQELRDEISENANEQMENPTTQSNPA